MGRSPQHPTLLMIATETGVSASTVSRVLNAKTDEAARRWASPPAGSAPPMPV